MKKTIWLAFSWRISEYDDPADAVGGYLAHLQRTDLIISLILLLFNINAYMFIYMCIHNKKHWQRQVEEIRILVCVMLT